MCFNGCKGCRNRISIEAEKRYRAVGKSDPHAVRAKLLNGRKRMFGNCVGIGEWRPYLLGRLFFIETDHKQLEWIKSAKDPREKIAR